MQSMAKKSMFFQGVLGEVLEMVSEDALYIVGSDYTIFVPGIVSPPDIKIDYCKYLHLRRNVKRLYSF